MANTFVASPALLDDEVQSITPPPQDWKISYPQPLSMAIIVDNYLLVVKGEEWLSLLALDIASGREIGVIDLGIWAETSAVEVSLWLDKFRLWVWSERWLSCVDLRSLTPQTLIAKPISLPEGTSVVGACFGLLWVEHDGKILQGLTEQNVREPQKPTYQFELPAPLKRFKVDRYHEAAFVASDNAILFNDECGNVWYWQRDSKNHQLLRENEQILLLPVWLNWRNRSEFVLVTEENGKANFLCFDGGEWRQVPLLDRPSGSHAVVIGEHLWLPCEGGQRWIECDADGKIIDNVTLPPQTRTLYAFSMGKELWVLQEQGEVIRLLQLKPQVREAGAWSLSDQPFALGKMEGKTKIWIVILRQGGEICARVVAD